ncbi:MAG: amidohydrolase [Gammaproteobacteria bacterium]|nr:amidohydrolase [Gammaproteobacteria bacterium]
MKHRSLVAAAAAVLLPAVLFAPGIVRADPELEEAVARDYEAHLAGLFEHFHRNPELSLVEHETAARMASEFAAAGFDVTEGVGGTGVVAMLENGSGPLVMMRADMDGLPVAEASGLPYASTATQVDPITGDVVATMHACGHDVHITSLVGTARQMAARRDEWAGTLMLVVQPAEERGLGARAMRDDGLWQRFGQPDYVLGFHVAAETEAGKLNVISGPTYAGVDSVDIVVHGVGSHGASPHQGKDPIVLASQIVLALQTLVSRELAPREPGVVTVGSFHSGTKHNIISDEARLQLTVRNTNAATRDLLLDGIRRIAENMGRAAGLPEELLPEVIVSDERTPPGHNDPALTARLRAVWEQAFGAETIVVEPPTGMGGEDFAYFTIDPEIPSVFWRVGGTPAEDFERARAGGPPVPSHHSPLFKIAPEPSVTAGVASTVVALRELMPR